jgi:hypothetical protein
MGSLGLAFDTIIVGALALPWVFLVVHLFFPQNVKNIGGILDWVNKQNQPAVAGILLFAMAYPLGSVVSRIAQDCFDDDDLYVEVPGQFFFRVGVTTTGTRILTHVFCQENNQGLVSRQLVDALSSKSEQSDPCHFTGRWMIHGSELSPNQPDQNGKATAHETAHDRLSRVEGLAIDFFHVEEGKLLLQGTDKNERLRQYHDERMVLRGAAFDGLVTFSLCLFWWSSERRSKLRYAVPFAYLIPGGIALYNHLFRERSESNPPLLEFTLLVLALAGLYLVWRRRPKGKDAPGTPGVQDPTGRIRTSYLVLSLLLTVTAFLGWQATEVLYDQQVIYSSYKALSETPAKSPTPTSK